MDIAFRAERTSISAVRLFPVFADSLQYRIDRGDVLGGQSTEEIMNEILKDCITRWGEFSVPSSGTRQITPLNDFAFVLTGFLSQLQWGSEAAEGEVGN
jgi:hypothetical protein